MGPVAAAAARIAGCSGWYVWTIARPGRSPRPARPDRLDEKLVRPFRGSLVGEVQGDIRRDDADQSDGRDVEALGDEARPDEDVDPPVAEGVDDPLRGAAMLDDVAVEPADPKRRETVTDLAFDPFGAAAEIADPGRAAGGQRDASGVARPQ